MTQLNEEVMRRRNKIAKHFAAIGVIQEACRHPKETLWKVYRGSTGNYDPSCDRYWAEYDCQLCGKHWTGDQDDYEGVEQRV